MAFSLHGTKVPHRKNTHDMPAVRMPIPATVTIPLAMGIGKPSIPCVKAGDAVKVGTLIGEAGGYVGAHVYSSVSGTVKKIDDVLASSGALIPAVIIESDGLMTPDESVTPPTINFREDLLEAIKKSGLVGLGGAGFPTYVKYNVDPSAIQEVIVNCAECEPYITSDNCTMLDRTDDIQYAVWLLKKYLGVPKIIFGIESNKPAAAEKLKKICEQFDGASVKVLPSVYPQGGEKVLIYHITGKVVPAGELPIDVGCIVSNVTTLAELGKFATTGMPLVERCITVDGSAVKTPKNVIAPIGTAMQDIFDFCGGLSEDVGKVFYGGPMMGITVPDTGMPIIKTTNAIIALTEKDAYIPEAQPCIRCGRCVNVCPFGINPPLICKAFKAGDVDTLEKLGTQVCMECGCCQFVCPAHRPIVQNNKLAKALIREKRAKEAGK